MHLEQFASWMFLASLLLPVTAFLAGTIAGMSAIRLARVMVGFWVPSLFATVAALATVEATPTARRLLIANGSLYAALVLPKLIFGRRRAAPEQSDSSRTPSDVRTRATRCSPVIINQGSGGIVLPFHERQTSGSLGWYFCMANYYEANIDLNITATPDSATGTASARGSFSAWYSVNYIIRNATASATGHIVCESVADHCDADAAGAQDHVTHVDYTAAVVVTGGSSGAKASLHVDVAAAVAGQIAISNISVGVKGGGGSGAGVAFNIPNYAIANQKASRSYTYRCASK